MENKNKSFKLYNVLFPIWMLPEAWLIVLVGNFAIDSLVLYIGMSVFKIEQKLEFYKKHILKVFGFGLLADILGAVFMFVLMFVFNIGAMGDELYLTIPGLIVSAVLIYVFNYNVTFKDVDQPTRKKLSLLFAIVTAPYTFLIPSRVIWYGTY
ncbi:MAG: hypothetical protein HUJ57_07550 [Erysipelotrichaceae bacterium]|nr:hypothetical protein [Erysipelotrichaceae bacterium]